MSNDQLEAFLQHVKNDPSLQEQLSGIQNFSDLQALGRSLGYELTQGDPNGASELTDEELEAVTGGFLDKMVAGISLMMLNPGCVAIWGGLQLVDAVIDTPLID